VYRKVFVAVSLVAAVLLGLIFIASGTGKLFGDIETSAQVMSFINDILPEALLIPPVIYFIYNILVPCLFPAAELVLGVFLLIGFVPVLAALLSLPLLQEINTSVSSDKLVLLTVHGPGREGAIRSLLESEKVTFTVLLDSEGATGYKYNIMGVPSVFIIDDEGIIRMKDPVFNNLQEFESLLKQI